MRPKKAPTVRLVFDRKHVATKSGVRNAKKGLVQIEVMYQRKRKYISTGVKLYADQWKQNAEQHVVASSYSIQYNETITQALRSVMDAINSQDGNYNLDTIDVKDKSSLSVHDFGASFLKSKNKHTSLYYKQALNYMLACEALNDIRTVTRKDVETFLASLSDLHQTTQAHYAGTFVRIMRKAVIDGIIQTDPTLGVKIPTVKPRQRTRLTDEQLTALATMNGLTLPQERARDIFLFQCYTGLSWADVSTLTHDMIIEENGHKYIVRTRHKTGIAYRTMLLKPAAEILNRYGGTLPIRAYNNYALELSNLSEKLGVHLTSHVGRHTFATWALSHGTPIEIVSKMLGHTKIETTQIYAKILAKDVDAQFERLDKLF